MVAMKVERIVFSSCFEKRRKEKKDCTEILVQ